MYQDNMTIVFFQLPAPQLENALSKNPILKAPLVEHATQPNVRSTLPRFSLFSLYLIPWMWCSSVNSQFLLYGRSTLVVLGLAEEQQQLPPPATQQAQSSQTQAQSSQNQAAETSSSAADTTEVTQESSAAS
jgi:symplekin